jgi:hypothetical protein
VLCANATSQIIFRISLLRDLANIAWDSQTTELLVEVKAKVKLQPTVSQLVYLGSGDSSAALRQISGFCPTIDVGRPLWREHGSIIHSYNCFCAFPEQSLSGPSSAELTTSCCFIAVSPNLEVHVPVFVYPRNRIAQLYPRALGSLFVASYASQGYGWGIVTHFHTGHLSLYSTLAAVYILPHSTYMYKDSLCIQPTQCIYVFRAILTINSDYLPVGLCSGDVMCF